VNSVSVSKPVASAGTAAEHAVARKQVGKPVTEDPAHKAAEHAVAEAVAEAIGAAGLAGAGAVDHIQPVIPQQPHHGGRGGRFVGVVTVHQHVDVGLDVGEHPADHVALALQPLLAHQRTCRAGGGHGIVSGIVVIDVDRGLWQGRAEIGDDFRYGDRLIVAGDQNGDAHGPVGLIFHIVMSSRSFLGRIITAPFLAEG
jgi:hypothetical protein